MVCFSIEKLFSLSFPTLIGNLEVYAVKRIDFRIIKVYTFRYKSGDDKI